MELIRVTDELYNKVVDPAFVKKHGDLASVLAVTIEELTEYSWKDFLSEELYEDGLETYLERVSLDMTNFTSKEAEEKKEKTAGSDTKKVVVVDEKALARMYQYIQRNYGKTWLSESEEKSRNYQLCRGIHSDCSLYYTEGVLKNPVGKYYQLSYAQKMQTTEFYSPRGCGRWDGGRMRICSGWSSGGIPLILLWIFSWMRAVPSGRARRM